MSWDRALDDRPESRQGILKKGALVATGHRPLLLQQDGQPE